MMERFFSEMEEERRKVLSSIHDIIVGVDQKVVPEFSKMMGQEMLVYKCNGIMKYGLASGKSHMSLHVMPMYGSVTIHQKFKKLLPKARFLKGCINFKSADEMPPDIIDELIRDCARIDLSSFFSKKPAERHASGEWLHYHKKQGPSGKK